MQKVIKVIFDNQTKGNEIGSSLFRLIFLPLCFNSRQHSFFPYDEELVLSTGSSETLFQGHGSLSGFGQSFLNSNTRTNPFS